MRDTCCDLICRWLKSLWRKATRVIPAQAGIQSLACEEARIQQFGRADWTPPSAGVTVPRPSFELCHSALTTRGSSSASWVGFSRPVLAPRFSGG